MRKIVVGVLLIVCGGCSGGMSTKLVEAEMRLSLPMFVQNQRVDVFYPGRGESKRGGETMVQAFGPSWRSLEDDYPAYNFNP